MEIPVFDVSRLRIVGYINFDRKVKIGKLLDLKRGSFIVCDDFVVKNYNSLMIYVLPLRINYISKASSLKKYFINLERLGYKIVGYFKNGEIIFDSIEYEEFVKVSDSISISY